jgi:hypothetical protein
MIIDINSYFNKTPKSNHVAACSSTRRSPPLLFQPYLADVTYPVIRHDLIGHAERQHAPEAVIELLKKLENNVFDSPNEVAKELERLK